MNPDQIAKARALSKCSFSPGTPDKRFVRDVAWSVAHHPESEMSAMQEAYLAALCYKYRLQLAHHVEMATWQRWCDEGYAYARRQRDDAAKAQSAQDVRNWWMEKH